MNSEARNWRTKFADSFKGVTLVLREGSFLIHLVAAAAVIVAGFAFRVSKLEWCVLLLCIFSVLAAEAFNSSIERLARAVTSEHDENVGNSLDIAAGAVVIVAIGAATAGLIIFVPKLLALLESAR